MSKSGFMGGENASSADHISKILNSKKIRYEKLDELFRHTIPADKRLTGKQVNIYVDLAAVIKQLYNPELLEHFRFLKERDRIIISSEIINIVGHYRHYFASRKNMYTRFYFYFSYAPSKYHIGIYPEYRKEYYDKRNNMKNATFGVLSRILKYNMQIIKSVLSYIPNTYFIDSGAVEPSVIPHYIISEIAGDEDFNLILTNDDLMYQDLFIKDRTYILEMRGSDKSELIYAENLLDYLLSGTKKDTSDYPNVFAPDIMIMDAMTKHTEYDIKSVGRKGHSTAMAAIDKLKDRSFVGVNNYDIDSLLELAPQLFPKSLENQEEYIRNLSLVNHAHYMNNHYERIQNKIESQIIDLSNNPELKKLNEEVYDKYPLNLEFIMKSEVDHEVLNILSNKNRRD